MGLPTRFMYVCIVDAYDEDGVWLYKVESYYTTLLPSKKVHTFIYKIYVYKIY